MNTNEQQPTEEAQVMTSESAYGLIAKAEIDSQISTAKAFPRSLTKFQRQVMSMATLNAEIAESCAYKLPRGGKTIEGPSVRLAEIVASSYGNLRTGARVVYNDGKTITAQGIVHDLENNILHTEEVQRRITDKHGKTYSEDMIVIAGRAACAIAYRNAVFKVVPAALIEDIYEKVKEVARGTAETLIIRRDKRLNYFRNLGVKDDQICAALDVREIGDIDLDKLTLLQGMVTALKNGESTLEGLFPTADSKNKAKKAQEAVLNKLNKTDGNSAEATGKKMEADLANKKNPL